MFLSNPPIFFARLVGSEYLINCNWLLVSERSIIKRPINFAISRSSFLGLITATILFPSSSIIGSPVRAFIHTNLEPSVATNILTPSSFATSIGAMRNNNTKMFEKLGADTGFDSVNDFQIAEGLSKILDRLERKDALPKTILYTLNPKDNYVLGTMLGNFQGGGVPGKIQFGSGWWFNDQRDGMESQMKTLANLGMLSRFVGMLTDSRSFVSYTRHEYFRRILCNLIGSWVEKGEYPNDQKTLKQIVEGICYYNAKEYFGF